MLRNRGVPKETAMAFKLRLARRIIEVAARPHTDDELTAAIEESRIEREQRMIILDRRSVILDGVVYERAAQGAKTM